jgi:hypothetical protein
LEARKDLTSNSSSNPFALSSAGKRRKSCTSPKIDMKNLMKAARHPRILNSALVCDSRWTSLGARTFSKALSMNCLSRAVNFLTLPMCAAISSSFTSSFKGPVGNSGRGFFSDM